MKRGAERIADDIADVAAMRRESALEDGVVARVGVGPCCGGLLREARAALDVREQERDGAGLRMLALSLPCRPAQTGSKGQTWLPPAASDAAVRLFAADYTHLTLTVQALAVTGCISLLGRLLAEQVVMPAKVGDAPGRTLAHENGAW